MPRSDVTPADVVLQTYFDAFCALRPLDDMRAVLHSQVQVKGPLLDVDTADAYLESLAADEPRPRLTVDIVAMTTEEMVTTVRYTLSGEGRPELDVTQRFTVDDGRITHMTLAFDVDGVAG